MRLTIIRTDGFIAIDGIGYRVDLTSIDHRIHAVQWYDDRGEIEYADSRGRIVENVEITSLDDFQHVISLWHYSRQQDLQNSVPTVL